MRTIAVVGASIAGLHAARALRGEGYEGRLVLIGSEPHPPYDRPPLSKELLAGTVSPEDVSLLDEEDASLDIEWHLATTATALVPRRRAIVLEGNEELEADGVVIATGASARQLPVKEHTSRNRNSDKPLAGVHVLRTLDDALALRSALCEGGDVVVVGAGFIGSEVASTARGLGAEVHVVEAFPLPLLGALGAEMGAVCAALHREHGVQLHCGVGVDGLLGTEHVTGVRLSDGHVLEASTVVVGIGAVPATAWLEGSGLELANGVICDARCATAIPEVVAAGDVARAFNAFAGSWIRYEHWTNAVEQPAVAASTLLRGGEGPTPTPRPPYFWSDQYGVRIQFAGHREPSDTVRVVEGDVASRSFVACYERGSVVTAVLGVDQPKAFNRLRRTLSPAPTGQ